MANPVEDGSGAERVWDHLVRQIEEGEVEMNSEELAAVAAQQGLTADQIARMSSEVIQDYPPHLQIIFKASRLVVARAKAEIKRSPHVA